MAQGKFLWPFIPSIVEGSSYDAAQAEFDTLTFMNGSLTSLKPGTRPFEGGRGTGAFYYKFTHDDIIAAGDQQDQEFLIALPYQPILAAEGTVFALRTPASTTGSGTNGGTINLLIDRPQIHAYVRNTANNNSFGQATLDISALTAADFPRLVRFRVSGLGASVLIQIRHWHINDPEPATWNASVTTTVAAVDTGIPAIFRNASGFSSAISHFSMGTAGDIAPAIYGSISGTVVEHPDTPLVRTVRAVAREDPMLCFETQSEADGTFRVGVLLGYTYTVYAMDSTFNAVVADRVIPVDPDA